MKIIKRGELPPAEHVGYWRCNGCGTVVYLDDDDIVIVGFDREDDVECIDMFCGVCPNGSGTYYRNKDPRHFWEKFYETCIQW